MLASLLNKSSNEVFILEKNTFEIETLSLFDFENLIWPSTFKGQLGSKIYLLFESTYYNFLSNFITSETPPWGLFQTGTPNTENVHIGKRSVFMILGVFRGFLVMLILFLVQQNELVNFWLGLGHLEVQTTHSGHCTMVLSNIFTYIYTYWKGNGPPLLAVKICGKPIVKSQRPNMVYAFMKSSLIHITLRHFMRQLHLQQSRSSSPNLKRWVFKCVWVSWVWTEENSVPSVRRTRNSARRTLVSTVEVHIGSCWKISVALDQAGQRRISSCSTGLRPTRTRCMIIRHHS